MSTSESTRPRPHCPASAFTYMTTRVTAGKKAAWQVTCWCRRQHQNGRLSQGVSAGPLFCSLAFAVGSRRSASQPGSAGWLDGTGMSMSIVHCRVVGWDRHDDKQFFFFGGRWLQLTRGLEVLSNSESDDMSRIFVESRPMILVLVSFLAWCSIASTFMLKESDG